MITQADFQKPAVRELYQTNLDCWNRRDAAGMAALYGPRSLQIGFDGSQMVGAANIESTLNTIFANHMTAMYIGIVREVYFISSDVAILHAVAGMLPRDKREINPAVNVVQTLVAKRVNFRWHIELFQNTPAAYHGRPDDSAKLTAELQAAADKISGFGARTDAQ